MEVSTTKIKVEEGKKAECRRCGNNEFFVYLLLNQFKLECRKCLSWYFIEDFERV